MHTITHTAHIINQIHGKTSCPVFLVRFVSPCKNNGQLEIASFARTGLLHRTMLCDMDFLSGQFLTKHFPALEFAIE
jgi:hypothetical protein